MLEEFTVRIGRGARVEVRKERGVEMPKEVWERGWIGGKGSELLTGNGIESEPVNLFWFEKKTGNRRNRGDGYRARSGERIVLYLFGGGFVCGSPGEGGRCYKIARETGLRVVGKSP
jgi:acetyl esterase/lipase